MQNKRHLQLLTSAANDFFKPFSLQHQTLGYTNGFSLRFMIFSHIKHDWKRIAPGCEESCLWVALSSFNATCHWHNYSHKHRCFCLPVRGYIATASDPLWFCKGHVHAPSILATKSLGHFLSAQLVQALLKGYRKTPLRAPELNMLYKHFRDQWTTTKIYQNHGQCIHFASSL